MQDFDINMARRLRTDGWLTSANSDGSRLNRTGKGFYRYGLDKDDGPIWPVLVIKVYINSYGNQASVDGEVRLKRSDIETTDQQVDKYLGVADAMKWPVHLAICLNSREWWKGFMTVRSTPSASEYWRLQLSQAYGDRAVVIRLSPQLESRAADIARLQEEHRQLSRLAAV